MPNIRKMMLAITVTSLSFPLPDHDVLDLYEKGAKAFFRNKANPGQRTDLACNKICATGIT